MRKRKTHAIWLRYDLTPNPWWSVCSRMFHETDGEYPALRPTCLNCQRVLKARKEK